MESLKDKIALVTGVGRKKGIGAAICRELAKSGVNIFFTYWHKYDEENYSETKGENPGDFVDELKRYGVRVASAEIDLSQPDSPEKLFGFVVSRLGVPDILINNACYDREVSFTELTPEILDAHYAVNVRATTLLCKEFSKAWKKGKKGVIINMTSGQSLGSMGGHKIPYTQTKASVEMLAIQLAPEFAKRGISINALDPGPTDTGWMTDEMRVQILMDSKKGKINMPEDTAKVVVSMLLDNTGTTGQVIHAER